MEPDPVAVSESSWWGAGSVSDDRGPVCVTMAGGYTRAPFPESLSIRQDDGFLGGVAPGDDNVIPFPVGR